MAKSPNTTSAPPISWDYVRSPRVDRSFEAQLATALKVVAEAREALAYSAAAPYVRLAEKYLATLPDDARLGPSVQPAVRFLLKSTEGAHHLVRDAAVRVGTSLTLRLLDQQLSTPTATLATLAAGLVASSDLARQKGILPREISQQLKATTSRATTLFLELVSARRAEAVSAERMLAANLGGPASPTAVALGALREATSGLPLPSPD